MDIREIRDKVKQITPDRLRKILDGKEDWFLLDVRNDIEYAQWKLEGKKTPETLNIPYFDFFEDEEKLISKIPSELPILVVCAKGDSSAYVADLLNQHGKKALNLRGGTAAWGDYYASAPIPGYGKQGTSDTLLQVNRVGKGCLAYFLVSEGEALVIDPGRHNQVYQKLADEMGARITHILDTHLHADHISGAAALAKATGAAYYIQSADVGPDAPLKYSKLQDGQTFQIGKSKVRVIVHFHPGHTPGSTSFLIDDKFLMTGDTLFVNGVGRPDLGGMVEEWARLLYDSLFHKLADLSDELVILPAHFSSPGEVRPDGLVMGSLKRLRKENPALKIDSEDAFVEYMRTQISEQPATYKDIRLVNTAKKRVNEDEASELEIGKNECAAKKH